MRNRRHRYLVGAVCVGLCTVMLLPLLASMLASVKTTEEAAEVPPTYFPHGFSLEAYRRLWEYQDGLPTYLLNSLGTALLTVVLTVFLTGLAGYGLARFPIPFKEPVFVVMLLALIIPYQALLTPCS
jgi:multiple sugar transport system permease protein